jgi:NADH dehydrogenase
VVVGAGFVGLEAATELAARGRVLLVDRSEVVGDRLAARARKSRRRWTGWASNAASGRR